MNWTTVLLLASVLWVEGGLRRLPARSAVLQQVLGGAWKMECLAQRARWIALGSWPGVTLSIVVAESSAPSSSPVEIALRLERVRGRVTALRWLGGLIGVLLVLGAPLAAARHGGFGVLVVGFVIAMLSLVVAGISAFAVRTLGAGGASLTRFACSVVWPFSAAYAADRVVNFAAAGAAPILLARELMGDERFVSWARPHAFDALAATPRPSGSEGEEGELRPLVEGFDIKLSVPELRHLLATPAVDACSDGMYCPRCGREYRLDVVSCEQCGGLGLVGAFMWGEQSLPPGHAGRRVVRS